MASPPQWIHEILDQANLLQHEEDAVKWSDDQGCSLVYIVRDDYAGQLAAKLHLRPMEITELNKAIELVSARSKHAKRESRSRDKRHDRSRNPARTPPILEATAKRYAVQPPQMTPPDTEAPRGGNTWCSKHQKIRSANKLEYYRGKWYCKKGQRCGLSTHPMEDPVPPQDSGTHSPSRLASPPFKRLKKEIRDKTRPTEDSPHRELMKKIIKTVADKSRLKGLVHDDGYWSLNQLMSRWAIAEGHIRRDVVHAIQRNLFYSTDPSKLRFALKPSRGSSDTLVRVVPKE